VDANTMKVLTSIPADSYPVGLDVSKDGKYVFTTAQGHSGKGGGNAVDIFKITYNTNPSNK
jgi:DNA-binding beta-propeller fold protein YncE